MIAHDVIATVQFPRAGGGISGRSVREYQEIPTGPFSVTQVIVTSSNTVQKDEWEFLKLLPNLTTADMVVPAFDDDALALLAGHPKLSTITLHGTNVSETGLRHLLKMPQLRFLNVYGLREGNNLPKITDDAVQTLIRVPSLTSLKLSLTEITDKGLKQITIGRPTLTYLWIERCSVTTKGLSHCVL